MKRIQFIVPVLIACLLSWSRCTYAGTGVQVEAKIDTAEIRIGEQFHVRLTAIIPPGSNVSFPVIPDTMRGLEVVRKSALDTLRKEGDPALTLQQQLTITGFDSGFYVIEPFRFVARDAKGLVDSLSTEAQLISIKTIPVDTTKAIKDIKPVMEPPFDWHELIPYLIGFLVLLILAIAGYLIYRKIKNKPVVPVIVRKPARPAHETALEALAQLEKEKLWQQGAFKEYHIRLSDIIRAYVEERFGVASLESTTDETLAGLTHQSLASETLGLLERMLRLADFVKFAKAIPIITENEQAMADARQFIQRTMAQSSMGKEVES